MRATRYRYEEALNEKTEAKIIYNIDIVDGLLLLLMKTGLVLYDLSTTKILY